MRLLLIVLILFSSCTGYRLEYKKNPFEQYGIKSISIPMFINRSSLANVSGHFSREIILALSQYPGLKILAGESSRADAILLGIITGPEKQREMITNLARIYTIGELEDAIGSRGDFYVPSSTEIKLQLQIVLIKDPSFGEKQLLKDSSLSKALRSPKIVLNVEMPISGSYARTIKGGTTSDSGNVVNFTSNHGLMNRTLKEMAKSAAMNFKETIANAF